MPPVSVVTDLGEDSRSLEDSRRGAVDGVGDGDAAVALDIRPLEPEVTADLLDHFGGERTGYVRVGPHGYLFPASFATDGHNLRNFKPRPTDTWVVTFPRSGTTWTQEMVWLIQSGLDYETALKVTLNERFPFFEFSLFLHPELREELLANKEGDLASQQAIGDVAEPMYRALADLPEGTPRFIKTHLPLSLLPRDLLTCGAKVLYVARNPKDVAVSYYHLNRTFMTCDYTGNFDRFWNYFENDLLPWTPYWSHLAEGWAARHHPNVLFMFYEQMAWDTCAGISKVANFCGKEMTEKEITRLADHLNIANFRKNPSVNSEQLYDLGVMRRDRQGYVRNGRVGGWVSEFTPELSARADRWIQENLKRTNIQFPHIPKVNVTARSPSG